MTDPRADPRRAEIAANLERVEARIATACAQAGRDRAEVALIVVTKTFPASDVGHLAVLGVQHVGENRADEAAEKEQEVRDAEHVDLTWHFVGQLQTNKAALVARHCDVVHSVDRARLVAALERAAVKYHRRLDALVQVDLSGDPGRGGAPPAEVAAVADAVAAAEHLELRGVMAIAPLDAEPGEAFTRLAEVAAFVRRDHPGATAVSAGMSADLEAAVAHGATHLRVGSALLGSRPPLR